MEGWKQRTILLFGVIVVLCVMMLVSYQSVVATSSTGTEIIYQNHTIVKYINHTIYQNNTIKEYINNTIYSDKTIYVNNTVYVNNTIYVNNTVYVDIKNNTVSNKPEIKTIYVNNTIVQPRRDDLVITKADDDLSADWNDDDGNLRYVTLMYKSVTVDDDLSCVRRIVGSVHHFEHEKIKITVFGYEVPEDFYLEVRTFALVRYVTVPREHGATLEAARAYMMETSRKLYAKFLYVDTFKSQDLPANADPKKNYTVQLAKEGLAARIAAERGSGKISMVDAMDNPTSSYGFIRGEGEGVKIKFSDYLQVKEKNDDGFGRCTLLRNISSPYRTKHVFSHHNENFLKKETRHLADDTLVCISIATFSGSNPSVSVDEFSLMSKVMTSFLASTAGVDTPASRYRFALYLGLQRDKFYDDPVKFEELTSKIIKMTADRSFSLRTYYTPLNSPAMDITYKWNVLIDQGYRDSCDYIYQYSDDTVFISPWVDAFVGYLEAESNFGMVGATDQYNAGIMTLAFSHRTHISILGSFWPTHFKNWWSDTWAQYVYGERYTKHFSDVLMRNTQQQGQRYPPCEHEALYKTIKMDESRPAFVKWLKQQPQTYDIRQKLDYYENKKGEGEKK